MANELVRNVKPNRKRMLIMANTGFTTSTDFADFLVKEKKLSFREAYKISSKVVNYAETNNKTLDKLNLKELKRFYKNLDSKTLKIFDVRRSMNSKNSYGGTSEKNIKSMIKKYKMELR